MKRWKALVWVALLCAIFCLPGGAGRARAEAEGDDAAVAATVNGVAIVRRDVARRMASARAINAQADTALTEEEKAARDAALWRSSLDALIEETALLTEADRRGLTADVLREEIDERYGRALDAAKDYVLAAYPNLSEEELLKQVESLLGSMGSSLEATYESARRAATLAALDRALSTEMAAPALSDMRERYEALWREQKALFEADENALEAALLQGELVLCRPRALKLLKKAEFLFDEGALMLINQTKATSPAAAEEMLADQYGRARARAEEALAALESGETSFDALLEALEPGSSARVNYFHETSTRFSESYAACASALATPGEHSELFDLPNGCAILYYQGELPALERVPFEDVSARMAESWARDELQAALADARAAIVAGATVERFGEVAP